MLIKIRKLIFKVIKYFFIISIVSTIIFRFLPIPITPLMLIRCVQKIGDGKMPILKKDWKSIDEISDKMQLAVIASEDQKFDTHFGFDFKAISSAIQKNRKLKAKGKPIRGGSTISQQCAKNLFLFPSRNFIRKGFEVYFTFLIEIFWSKERILEVYLNIIEMGDGIYGTEAAAQNYFSCNATKLNANQSALIAACLPNPRKFNPSKPTGFINKRKNWILKQMQHLDGTIKLN